MIEKGTLKGIRIGKDDIIYFGDKIVILDEKKIRKKIMYEFHVTPFSAYPRVNKMRENLKKQYYWRGMKNDIIEYVTKCIDYQKVKIKYNHPMELLHPLAILEQKMVFH